MGKAWTTLLTLCLVLARSPATRADEAEVQAARQLGKEAIESYQAGDYATAVDKLHRAYRVIPATTFGLWLARALVKQGNLVEASEWYIAVIRTQVPDDASQPLKEAQLDARKEHQELQPRIPSVVVTVENGTGSDTTVTVDQRTLKPALWGVRFPVNPGTHRISGQRGEEALAFDVTLAEGQSSQVPLAFSAQAAPAAGPPPPAAMPPPTEEPPPVAQQPPPPADEPPPEETPAGADENTLPVFAVVPKIALQLAGSGTHERTCEDTSCGIVGSPSFDYSHQFGVGFGADFLFTFAKVLRVGLGPTVILPSAVNYENDEPKDFGVGADMTVNAIVEAMFKIAGSTWLGPRLQGGLFVLFPGEDMEAYQEAKAEQCDEVGGSGCDSVTGAKTGWNIGAGVGFLQGVSSSARLRADFLFQHHAVTLGDVIINGGDVSETMSSNRFFLMFGAETP